MNSPLTRLSLVVLSLFASTTFAAEPAATAKPAELNLKTIDGQPLSARHLKGKVVVLEFWATWCNVCMEEMPALRQVNEKFAKNDGIQIIGVSWDASADAMKPVIEAQKMTWTHVNDPGQEIGKQFGVTQTANAVVLGPDGAVRWQGRTYKLAAALGDVLRKYPPLTVDPKVVKTAQVTLADADKKLAAGDVKGATRLMSRIPEEASRNAEFAKAADETRVKLDGVAGELLQAAESDAAAGKFKEAAGQFRELNVALAGFAVGDQAKAKLDELTSNPEAKHALEAADKEAKASAALDEAAKLRAAKKHELAYAAYKDVVKNYPDTPAAPESAMIVKKYESDPALMASMEDQEVGGKAKAALSMARSYAKAGKRDLAKKKYQSIASDFPGTSYAKTAKEELAKLK